MLIFKTQIMFNTWFESLKVETKYFTSYVKLRCFCNKKQVFFNTQTS